MAIRRLAPQETVSFYRRIFNGLFSAAAGGFADRADGTHVRPIRKQIIDAGPDLAFEGPEVFLGNQVARCLTPRSPARRITAERANRLLGGMRGAPRQRPDRGAVPVTLNILFDHSQFEIHKRAQILSAQKAAGSFAVEVGKQIEEIGWVLDEAGNSRFSPSSPWSGSLAAAAPGP
jgi:conjugal transfer ATP-binding protein TraC